MSMMQFTPQAFDLGSLVNGIDNLLFFTVIFEFIFGEIKEFQENTLTSMYDYLLVMAATLVTLWVTIKGYLIMTGRSKESLMELVVSALRVMFIVGMAGMVAGHGSMRIYEFLAKTLPDEISHVVAGSDRSTLERKIDINLVLMQAALGSIDQMVKVNPDDPSQGERASRAKMLIGIGMGGPAITGGALLIMNKVAIALFVGFAPLFILSLLFDQTKQLFSKWLYYGLGTMFAMAVLSAMVSIAMKVVLGVVGALWLRDLIGGGMGNGMDSITSMSMQQGGLGLILTILIVSAPPMAAAFFQGMLGQFSSYNQMAVQGAPQGVPANGGNQHAQPKTDSTERTQTGAGLGVNPYLGGDAKPVVDVVKPYAGKMA